MRRESRKETYRDFSPRLRSPVGLRRRSRLTLLVGIALCFLLFFNCLLPHRHLVISSPLDAEDVICPQKSIANDVLVVIRTGATEVLEKLPVHFRTTLRCVPDFVIYSDYEEDIEDHHIYDVFDGISDSLKASVPEFELYEHLRSQGRKGLNSTKHFGSGPSGSLDNPSWKLDRFKFLPMVDKALRHRPNAKWFVFMEADTYLVWQNLLEYLALLNFDRALYIGKHMYIGDVLFAHGGSGFVLSAAAMHKVTQRWRAHLPEYNEYTAQNWAGDMVLGKALRDVDVLLFWAFPHFQGDSVATLDHNVSKIERRPWCYAPITYHYIRKDDIEKLWVFEQGRRKKGKNTLLHRDIFREYVFPKLAAKVDDWDNLSLDTVTKEEQTWETCHATCETSATCLQFSHAAGKCSISAEAKVGYGASARCLEYSIAASNCIRWQEEPNEGGKIQSGWMTERILQYMEDMDGLCQGNAQNAWVI